MLILLLCTFIRTMTTIHFSYNIFTIEWHVCSLFMFIFQKKKKIWMKANILCRIFLFIRYFHIAKHDLNFMFIYWPNQRKCITLKQNISFCCHTNHLNMWITFSTLVSERVFFRDAAFLCDTNYKSKFTLNVVHDQNSRCWKGKIRRKNRSNFFEWKSLSSSFEKYRGKRKKYNAFLLICIKAIHWNQSTINYLIGFGKQFLKRKEFPL